MLDGNPAVGADLVDSANQPRQKLGQLFGGMEQVTILEGDPQLLTDEVLDRGGGD